MQVFFLIVLTWETTSSPECLYASPLDEEDNRIESGRPASPQVARQPGLVARDNGEQTAIAWLVHQSAFTGEAGIGTAPRFRLRIVFLGKSAAA